MPSSTATSSWHHALHYTHILPRSAIQPDPNQVLGPSDSTLSNIAGSLINIKEFLQSRDAVLDEDKDFKKDKFKDWSDSKRGMLLSLMTSDRMTPAKECRPEILSIVNQKTATRAKQEMKSDLANYNYICTIPMGLVSCMQSGYWLSRTPEEPSNFTVFGLDMRKNCGISEECSCRFRRERSSWKIPCGK